MGGGVWLNFVLVGLFGGRYMPKSFKAFGITKHALASQCPFAAFKLWEYIVGVWLRNWWWNFGEINHMIILACKKSFTSNGSRKVALPSQSSNLPPQTNKFF